MVIESDPQVIQKIASRYYGVLIYLMNRTSSAWEHKTLLLAAIKAPLTEHSYLSNSCELPETFH
jgi:hypothetical protein